MAIGFGGVADVPVVREWPRLGGSALDDALAGLAEEIEIVDDGDGGGAYRRGLVRTLGRRTVERAARRLRRALVGRASRPKRAGGSPGSAGFQPAEVRETRGWKPALPGATGPREATGRPDAGDAESRLLPASGAFGPANGISSSSC